MQLEQIKLAKKQKQEIFRIKNALRGTDGEVGALPDFVIIGAQKSGTTSLYHLLTDHSHVEPAAFKEVHFFDLLYEEGVEWYRQCFLPPRQKDGRKTITGEGTPGYLFRPFVPERMARVIPQARLIALLRNPVDRAYSEYQHRVRTGQETRSFEGAIEAEEMGLLENEHTGSLDHVRTEHLAGNTYLDQYLSRGLYVDHLERWSRFFDEEQMLVLKSEDFFERPRETLKLVLSFLDLPDWEPEAWKLRKKGVYEQGMDTTTRRRLEVFFEPHNRRLYAYLDREFGW